MQIKVKIGGRWKNCEVTQKLFDLYSVHAKNKMKRAKDAIKFKPPKELILRPYYHRTIVEEIWGRAMYGFENGYEIAICPDICRREKDKGLWVIDHELAHIVASIKYGDWSHSRNFDNTLKLIRKL